MIQRKGLIVYFENKEVLEKLDKTVVNIYYVSEKNKYAIIYCDLNINKFHIIYKQIKDTLNKYIFVF